MAELIMLIIIGAIYFINKWSVDARLENYDISKVSIGKMAMDTGKSKFEIRRNLVNGKYDKDDEWRI